MNTQAIQNPATAPIVSVQATKSPDPSSTQTSFSNVLNREISNRADTKNNNESATKETNNASAPSTAPTPTKSAEKTDDKDSSKDRTDEQAADSSTATSTTNATNTTTPAELLALVANIGQLTAPKIDAPVVDNTATAAGSSKTGPVITGIPGLVTTDPNAAIAIDPGLQDAKPDTGTDPSKMNKASQQTEDTQSTLLQSQFAQALQQQTPKQSTNTSKADAQTINLKAASTESAITTGTATAQTTESVITSDAANIAIGSENKEPITEVKVDGASVKVASNDGKSEGKFAAVLKETGVTKPTLEQTSAVDIPVAKADKSRAAVIDVMPVIQKEVQATATPTIATLQQATLNGAQVIQENATDKLTPRVGSPAWDQALGQKVVWMIGGAQQSATLTLNPPDLGPLQIVLNVSNTQATAAFTASQPEVRQALEAAMPKLREILNDAGIQLGQATVSTGTPNQHHNPSEYSPKATLPFTPIGDVAEINVPVTRTRQSTDGQGLIDTFA